MQPATELFTTTDFMFRDQWNNRIQRYMETWQEQKRVLGGIGTTNSKLTDRLIETTSPSASKAYESKLEKLEAEKALTTESLTKKPDINQEHRKTLLKRVFAAPLLYARKQGFRTAKTTSPFKVLAALNDEEKEMAERGGFEPPERLRAQRFSRPPRSTTPAPLRGTCDKRVSSGAEHRHTLRALQARK